MESILLVTHKKPELMAPAGDMTSLQAAINAGADAVYFGITSMNMRANAKNFAPKQMPQIAQICHAKNAKAYLTLNTIVFDNEVEKARQLVKQAAEAGIDAIICWDFAILQAALEFNIEPFISTQMSVSNYASIVFFHKNFGVKRFVLARECTLEDLYSIRQNLAREIGEKAKQIEIEVFAHGAMCVSISGRCFMSQFHFANSANRGECRQPCRREYIITDIRDGKSFVLGQDYVMSPKDLCTLPFLDQLLKAGIDSLKIEGRGRSPEYVSTVTTCYRRFIDFYFDHYGEPNFESAMAELKEELMKKLRQVFNRGFSDGFFFGRPIEDWTGGNGSKATHRKVYVGVVTNFFRKPMVAEIKVEANSFKVGDELMFQGPTTGVISMTAESIEHQFKPVSQAPKHSFVGVKVSQKVRENDQVYLMLPVEKLQNVNQ